MAFSGYRPAAAAAIVIAGLSVLQGCETPSQTEASVGMADEQHGRLLYDTACIACHTTQAHWRDKHVVHSWSDLLYQVTRWQHNAGQNWNGSEIIDVAAYLNERFYKLPCHVPGCGAPRELSGPQEALHFASERIR